MSSTRPPSGPGKRPFSRLVAPALLAVLTLGTGCTLPIGGSYTGAKPEDAVRQKHSQGITVVGARMSGDTAVVLSTGQGASRGPGSGSSEVYVDVVKRSGLGWNVPLGFTSNGIVAVPASATFCYATAEMHDQQEASSFVYGYVRPDVQSVEVEFANGQTLQDASADGMFAVIQPASDSATTVRALDSNGNTLHTAAIPTPRSRPSSLPSSRRVSSGGGGMSSFTCTP